MKPAMVFSGATFGDHKPGDEAYRFTLTREWKRNSPTLAFCMLNPSTADHTNNDPTVERCERRARALGFGRLIVVNLFAFRSTDPDKLYSHPNPTGGVKNDLAIIQVAQEAKYLVCGWGEHGEFMQRGAVVLALLRASELSAKLKHLGLNASGQPKHPLYISYRQELKSFR